MKIKELVVLTNLCICKADFGEQVTLKFTLKTYFFTKIVILPNLSYVHTANTITKHQK